MKNKENASNSLGALLNKSDTIIAIILTLIIAFLWFETIKFEKVPDLFSNNIPPEMFPQILLIIILGMVLIIPFEHIFLKKSGKNIDSSRKNPVEISTIGTMIKLLTKGVKLSDYRPDDIDDELEVLLRFKNSQRSLARLEELKIPSDQGEYIPMSIFAKLEPKPKNGEVQRVDGNRFMSISADVEDGLLPAKLIEKLKLT